MTDYPQNGVNALTICFVVALALEATGCARKASEVPPPATEVRYVVLQRNPVTLVTDLPGRTSPYRVAEVRPQVNGVIQKRMYKEGAIVTAGEQLYQIEPALYQAALDSARASLNKAQANTRAFQALADRYRPLAEAHAVSRQDLDNALSSLGQAEADAQVAKASIETAKINLDYTKVLSPIDGRSGRSMVTEGALVTANQSNALAIIQQLDPIYVDVTQPSTTLLRLQRQLAEGKLRKSGERAAEVTLTLEDGTRYNHSGKLLFSEVSVDPGTGSITLRAEFPNPEGVLLPGMFVHEQIQEGINETALLVPQQGVSRDQKGDPSAMVLDENGKARPQPIATERAIGDQWLVDDGLKVGDKVIVQGQIGLAMAPPNASLNAREISLDELRRATKEADRSEHSKIERKSEATPKADSPMDDSQKAGDAQPPKRS